LRQIGIQLRFDRKHPSFRRREGLAFYRIFLGHQQRIGALQSQVGEG
jgi:hypothetical protein